MKNHVNIIFQVAGLRTYGTINHDIKKWQSPIIVENRSSRDLDRHHLDREKRQSLTSQISLLRWVSDAILTLTNFNKKKYLSSAERPPRRPERNRQRQTGRGRVEIDQKGEKKQRKLPFIPLPFPTPFWQKFTDFAKIWMDPRKTNWTIWQGLNDSRDEDTTKGHGEGMAKHGLRITKEMT